MPTGPLGYVGGSNGVLVSRTRDGSKCLNLVTAQIEEPPGGAQVSLGDTGTCVPIYCPKCFGSLGGEYENMKAGLKDNAVYVVGLACVPGEHYTDASGAKQYEVPLDSAYSLAQMAPGRFLNMHLDKSVIGRVICYWHVHSADSSRCNVFCCAELSSDATDLISSFAKVGMSTALSLGTRGQHSTGDIVVDECSLVTIPARRSCYAKICNGKTKTIERMTSHGFDVVCCEKLTASLSDMKSQPCVDKSDEDQSNILEICVGFMSSLMQHIQVLNTRLVDPDNPINEYVFGGAETYEEKTGEKTNIIQKQKAAMDTQQLVNATQVPVAIQQQQQQQAPQIQQVQQQPPPPGTQSVPVQVIAQPPPQQQVIAQPAHAPQVIQYQPQPQVQVQPQPVQQQPQPQYVAMQPAQIAQPQPQFVPVQPQQPMPMMNGYGMQPQQPQMGGFVPPMPMPMSMGIHQTPMMNPAMMNPAMMMNGMGMGMGPQMTPFMQPNMGMGMGMGPYGNYGYPPMGLPGLQQQQATGQEQKKLSEEERAAIAAEYNKQMSENERREEARISKMFKMALDSREKEDSGNTSGQDEPDTMSSVVKLLRKRPYDKPQRQRESDTSEIAEQIKNLTKIITTQHGEKTEGDDGTGSAETGTAATTAAATKGSTETVKAAFKQPAAKAGAASKPAVLSIFDSLPTYK